MRSGTPSPRSETTVTLRNYRRDGELFCNRFTLQPLTDRNGQLIYFLDVQYDVTTEIEAQEEVERLRRLLEDQEAADKDSQDPR